MVELSKERIRLLFFLNTLVTASPDLRDCSTCHLYPCITCLKSRAAGYLNTSCTSILFI